MTFKMKYEIQTKYLTKGTLRRSGKLMPYVVFIVSHDTGNPGSTAAGNITYYENSRNEIQASAQTFIDDVAIIECIPVTTGKPEKAWQVLYNVTTDNALYNADANDVAIGVELCFGESWKNGKMTNKINDKEAYKRYVWYHAYLCYKFNLDPHKKIVGHNELDPARKTDPFKNSLKQMGISKAQFLNDVAAEYEDCTRVELPKREDDEPMKLAKWEKNMLIEGVKKYNKIIGTDGQPVINSPDLWITKINNEEVTAGDIALLNFAILSRTVK